MIAIALAWIVSLSTPIPTTSLRSSCSPPSSTTPASSASLLLRSACRHLYHRGTMISTEFDGVFARHAGGKTPIPVTYLRALAYRESGLNPRQAVDATLPNAARGLFQVVGVVRVDYNRRHGTDYTPADLYDPDINTQIATDTLREMMRSLARHPSKNLRPNWENPEFVRLITAAWNAGHSDSFGLGRVARELEDRGDEVTHHAVYAAGIPASAPTLSDPARARWQRSVADLYFDQRDRGSSLSIWIFAVIVVVLGYVVLSS